MQAGIKAAFVAAGVMLALSCHARAQELKYTPESAVAQAVALVRPSVVAIETRFEEPLLDDAYAFWTYFRGARPLYGLWGSGFVYKDPNYVVTSSFLMEHAEFIRVILDDNRSYRAELVDRNEDLDVAVLKIDWGPDFIPPSPPLGNSDSLVLGQPVAVVGKSLNSVDTYSSFGVISAIRKSIPGTEKPTDQFLQFDASYEMSFSGGPLVDVNGRVVGMIDQAVQDFSLTNINLGVPINDVIFAADAIIAGENTTIEFGGEITEIRAIQQQQGLAPAAFDWNADGTAEPLDFGMFVTSVVPGSPADRAGLLAGDVLVAIDGKVLKYMYDWTALRRTLRNGQLLSLGVIRRGADGIWGRTDLQCQVLAEQDEEDEGGGGSSGKPGGSYHHHSMGRSGR